MYMLILLPNIFDNFIIGFTSFFRGFIDWDAESLKIGNDVRRVAQKKVYLQWIYVCQAKFCTESFLKSLRTVGFVIFHARSTSS